MSNTSLHNNHKSFDALLLKIKQARQKAFTQVNTTLIALYWEVGKVISQKVATETWGKGIVKELAIYLKQNEPEIKGFSDKNLWRMKQFYETYKNDTKLSALVRELPWTHNTIIFSRCKTSEEHQFYSRNMSPALVAQYQLQLPDKKIIQNKLHNLLEQLPKTNLKKSAKEDE